MPRLPQACRERAHERGDELHAALAGLEETRRTAERELEAVGGSREEIEQLVRDREGLRAALSDAVPGNLDRLTPEGRNTLYLTLCLDFRPRGEGYEVTGPFCASEPLAS